VKGAIQSPVIAVMADMQVIQISHDLGLIVVMMITHPGRSSPWHIQPAWRVSRMPPSCFGQNNLRQVGYLQNGRTMRPPYLRRIPVPFDMAVISAMVLGPSSNAAKHLGVHMLHSG
jgi:hypothetical protein